MKSNLLGVLAFVLAGMLIVSPSAFAGGTKGGTTITNTATLTYKVTAGGADQTASASVNVIVAYVASVNVSTVPDVTEGDNTTITIPVTVTNTGNATDQFTLTYTPPNLGGPDWSYTVYLDDGNGTFEGTETATNTTGTLNGWTYDETGTVVAGGEQSAIFLIRLTIPFDLAVDGVGTGTIAIDGADVDPGAATVQISTNSQTHDVTIERASLVTSTKINSTTATGSHGTTPGDLIQYTITVANAGTNALSASSVRIADALPAGVTWAGNYTATWSNTSTDQGSFSPATPTTGNFTVTFTDPLPAGETITVVFDVSIDAGVEATTVLTNNVTATYNDVYNTDRTYAFADGGVTVTSAYAWSFEISDAGDYTAFGSTASTTVKAGLQVAYRIKLTNDGNNSDNVVFSAPSSDQSWGWSLYLGDGNATFEPGTGETAITAAYTSGNVAAGSSIEFWVSYTIPVGTAYTVTDVTTYTATSGNSGTVTPTTVTSTTDVQAPAITVTKQVFADNAGAIGTEILNNGAVNTGDVLWYIVSFVNTGDSPAEGVVLTDAIPAQVTLDANEVYSAPENGGTYGTWTNLTAGAGFTYAAPTLTYNVGTLNEGLTNRSYLRFKVTVKN